jgi:hypothetical protein
MTKPGYRYVADFLALTVGLTVIVAMLGVVVPA